MPLQEMTLFGAVDKVAVAIERLKAFEPPEGYYLAFSGGKDSQVIYDLAMRAGVCFDAHYSLTTVDPPELVKFIREEYPTVTIEKPPRTMWELIVHYRMLPTRVMRYCCRELKERGGTGRLVITGVRWAESSRRRQRAMTESCVRNGTKRYLHPIIDWTEDDVWEYHRNYISRHCRLYDEGWRRIGCILCPMSTEIERDMARWPKIAAAYRRAIERAWKLRVERGDSLSFRSADELWYWWIARHAKGKDIGQAELFPFDD